MVRRRVPYRGIYCTDSDALDKALVATFFGLRAARIWVIFGSFQRRSSTGVSSHRSQPRRHCNDGADDIVSTTARCRVSSGNGVSRNGSYRSKRNRTQIPLKPREQTAPAFQKKARKTQPRAEC